MAGSAESSAGLRSGPRSSPTTVSPAIVNSRARIAPVQPMPTMTASTSLNFFAMVSSLREVLDRLRFRDVTFVPIFVDLAGICCGEPGVLEHSPRRHVPISAVHRIGEKSFHVDRQQALKEKPGVEVHKFRLSFFHGF